eukprot:symbB.v1.2.008187.t1/scaffold450.1/size202773/6
MYGHIHIILKDLVITEFGSDKWVRLLKMSGFASEAEVLDTVPHHDRVTSSLLTGLCVISGRTPEEAVEALGHHLIVFSLRSGHGRFLKAQGATLPIFLSNVNGLHRQLERDHPGADFPFLQVCYDPVTDEADLRYLSPRDGFGRFVVGVVKAIGSFLFGVDVRFEEQDVQGFSNGRAKAWRMAWEPLPGGPKRISTSSVGSEILAPQPSPSFAWMHSAMMDMSKLFASCQLPASCGSTSRMANQKLAELMRSKMPEEDLLMRSTQAKTIAAAWSDTHLTKCIRFWETSEGSGSDYELSQDALYADGFVSHCWAPPENWAEFLGEVSYAEVKATTLAVMAKDIALGRGEELSTWNQVTFWADKACIPQDHSELKAMCVNLLEKFILKCEYTCVIFTWNYLDRLWCIYEWACILVSKDFHKIFLHTELLVQDATLPLYLDAVRHFSLKKAKCHKDDDRKLLEQKIRLEYTSVEAFENLMRATVIAFMARSMAHPAGRNPELETKFYRPWVQLASELGFCDLAMALGNIQTSEWRRIASSGSWLGQYAADIKNMEDSVVWDGLPSFDLKTAVDLHTVNSVEYHHVVLKWFDTEVTPILIQLRKEACITQVTPAPNAVSQHASKQRL